MRTTAELREGFLSFFESKGHLRCPSASLVPRADDRSTLLTSAGMQPQMPFFLGREQPPALLTTTVQKCFRTPDIDEVGLDGSHLTFFEMLGNFSFGQYFKEGAIQFAAEFIREHLELDWDRIWISVFAGDPQLGLGPDDISIELWEAGRNAARAHRAAAGVGELLVRRWAGAVRSRLRDLLRLGRGARLRRARLRAKLHALRALPRVLEPRLHGVRVPRGRHADAAARAEHRHGHGPRACERDRAERDVGLRDGRLPEDHGMDRGRVGRRLRRLGAGDQGAPRARRSRAWDDVPRGRRRHAVERGARLRAPQDHPARRATGAQHRAARHLPAAVGRDRADGRRVSRAGRSMPARSSAPSATRRSDSRRRSSAA